MSNSQRTNSECLAMTKSTMQLSGNEVVHAENYKFQTHEEQPCPANRFDSSILPTDECTTPESYDTFFQDAFNAINTEMEKYYSSLGKMEEKEVNVQSEIISKTEEMKKLSRILRAKRDSALQAIAQLTSPVFKRSNVQD
ncbi:uncharacterized protein LOC130693554 [Daphnia carinata]|uniref:uncharacterized protein LOC130693554 n=1 Tax=Daphnia carinata TaxID=120202 RepID=UPI0025795341|nr:uncharacterized protein LOC130693554 [Daphnia carinata]